MFLLHHQIKDFYQTGSNIRFYSLNLFACMLMKVIMHKAATKNCGYLFEVEQNSQMGIKS